MRKITRIAASAILSMVLAVGAYAAGAGEEKAQAPAGPMEVTFLGNFAVEKIPEEGNYVQQEIAKKYGILLKSVAKNYTDNAQMNVMYAAKEIPDMQLVRAANMARFASEGLFRGFAEADLQKNMPAYFQMLGVQLPRWREGPGIQEGKIYGLLSGAGNGIAIHPIMAIRTDWLAKVGLGMPKTVADFEEMCKRFALNDPDGNGQKDTYAFAIAPGNFSQSAAHLAASFGVFGGTNGGGWVKDSAGKYVPSFITAEYKEFMLFLARLYKNGYIYPDVSSNNRTDLWNLFPGGKVGVINETDTQMMPNYRPNSFMDNARKNGIKWEWAPVFQGPKPAVFMVSQNYWEYYAFGKDVGDEKMRRIMKYFDDQVGDNNINKLTWYGVEGEHFAQDPKTGVMVYTDKANTADLRAKFGIKTYYFNVRTPEQLGWSFGAELKDEVEYQKSWSKVDFPLPPHYTSPAQVKFGASLGGLQSEFFFKGLVGGLDINAEWDSYVKRWREAGGNEVISEINARLGIK